MEYIQLPTTERQPSRFLEYPKNRRIRVGVNATTRCREPSRGGGSDRQAAWLEQRPLDSLPQRGTKSRRRVCQLWVSLPDDRLEIETRMSRL